MNTVINWTAISANYQSKVCRSTWYLDATLRTAADYWVAVGVSRNTIHSALDELAGIENAACDGLLTEAQHTLLMQRFEVKMQQVIDEFAYFARIPHADKFAVFWRSTEAEIGRMLRLCGGGAEPEGVRSYLRGVSGTSIDLAGRSLSGFGEVAPITGPGSGFSTGFSVPCISAGGGGGTGGGGGGGGGGNEHYETWIWGESYSASSAPACFDANTRGNSCSPWSGAASFPDTEQGRADRNAANRDTALITIVAGGALAVGGVALCAGSVACAALAIASYAVTVVVAVKSHNDNYQEAPPKGSSPGQLCPIMGGELVATLRSPSGVGPLGESDVLEMCGKKCDVNTGANCIGINSKIGCNYNPIALNGYPIEECMSNIANDNPWMLWSKIEAEICGRMSCPLNTTAAAAPDGRCECTRSNGSGGGPYINWNCARVLCDPWGQRCAWGC